MKSKSIIIILIALINLTAQAQKAKITSQEFRKVIGEWNGKLVYLDYQSGKPYEMPANLEIIQIRKTNIFKFINRYPNEASANSVDTLIISSNGKLLDNERVKSKRTLEDGNLEIVTEIAGEDGNDHREALIKHTYLLGSNIFEIKKEVLFTGNANWTLRHTYKYLRNKPSR